MILLENISSVFLIFLLAYIIYLSVRNNKLIGIYNIFSLLATLSFLQILFSKYLSSSAINQETEIANSLSIIIYIILEFGIFILFFYSESRTQYIKKVCIGSIITMFVLILLAFYFHSRSINDMQITSAFIESTILISLSMLVFLEIIFDDTITSLTTSPYFIITFSIFFFSGITYPFYSLSFFISYSDMINVNFAFVNNIAYIIFYLLIIKGLKCKILIQN